MLVHQPAKVFFTNAIANISIELAQLKVDDPNSNGVFSYRDQAILYFAEFIPTNLDELSQKLGLAGKPSPSQLIDRLLSLMEETKQSVEKNTFDDQFEAIDMGNASEAYNLTINQKRCLRILVGLKDYAWLTEPMRYLKGWGRIEFSTNREVVLDPRTVVKDFTLFDLGVIAEENLLSLSISEKGHHSYTLKQSALIAVHNHFNISEDDSSNGRLGLGSPFGFTQADHVYVRDQKKRTNTLVVTLGHKFESTHYESKKLVTNLQEKFVGIVDEYNTSKPNNPITLDLIVLGAGYGEHLFNDIARNIMGSDISIFETSELSPNVMLEMGVALTWGVSVFPIKKKGMPEPPSDISGQTWVNYEENALFSDSNFDKRLLDLVSRVMAKKRGE